MRNETDYMHKVNYGKKNLEKVVNNSESSLVGCIQKGLEGLFKIERPFGWSFLSPWSFTATVSNGDCRYSIGVETSKTYASFFIKHGEVKDYSAALDDVNKIEEIIEKILGE